jgi:Chaperone of endosialidase
LSNTTGSHNTAIGFAALNSNTTGFFNTALGTAAGANIIGSGNVVIGQGIFAEAGVDDTTWIRNVYASVAVTRSVYVNEDNKIGTLASTRRVKDDIKPMDKASETIFALKPVTFRYKKDIDRYRTPQFGLVAEDVAQVNPELVTQDENGQPETVRYEAVNAMLLNEFLKEHRKNEEQQAIIAQQQKQIEALTAGLQRVNAQLELSKPAPQTVKNAD